MRMGTGLGVLLAFLIAAQNVSAVPITFAFSGTTTLVGADVDDGTVSIGESVSGQFTFESDTPDSDGSTDVGSYLSAITAAEFTFGTYSGTAGSGNISVRDDYVTGFGTFDIFGALGMAAITGSDVNGRALENFNLQLLDDTLTMLSSDALPTTAPSPFRNDNANTTFLLLQFEPVLSTNIVAAQIRATVDSVSLVATDPEPSVPEPSTILLFAASIVGLRFARLKRV